MLGVSSKAISKWENGRGLPDLGIIKPLCEKRFEDKCRRMWNA